MKCIQKWVLSEPLVDPIDHHDILSTNFKFYEIDLKKVKKEELNFENKFELKIEIEGKIYGFVCWFDCYFSFGSKRIVLSTSPYKKSTHWKQTIFYLQKPFKVDINDQIKGILKVHKASDNMRQLDVKLNFAHNEDEMPIQHYRIS